MIEKLRRVSSGFIESLHIFSVTGNKNRKIWQEMEVGCGENAACGGARAFFDAAGHWGRRPPYRGRLTGRVILHCKPRKGKACGYFFL